MSQVVAVSFRPASRISVPGHYDRLPYSPGPGAVPRRVLPLPRLESLAGALARLLPAHTGSREPGRDDWASIVLGRISGCLGDGCSARIWGPLLRVGDSFYVNARAGLLRLDYGCFRFYMRLHRLAVEEAGETVARARASMRVERQRILEEMRGRGCLVGLEEILSLDTQVALDRSRKAPRYGLLYSMAYADYSTLASRHGAGGVEILVFIEAQAPGCSPCEDLYRLEGATELKPTGLVSVTARSGGPPWRPGCIVSSPAPLRDEALDDGELLESLVHPLDPGRPPLIEYGRGYAVEEGFRKEEPRVALAPGTVLLPDAAERILDAPEIPGGGVGLWYLV